MGATLNRIAVMAVHNTRRAFRSPANVLWMLIVPIVFGLIVSFFLSSQENGLGVVYVVDEDRSDEARAFVSGMEAYASQVRLLDRDAALTGLTAGDFELVIVIPAGFGEAVSSGVPTLELLQGSGYQPGAVESTAQFVAGALARDTSLAQAELLVKAPNGTVDNGAFAALRSVFGVYLVFALAALLARGGALHQERSDGTLQRLVAAGVPFGEVVAAHVVTIFLVGLLQACIVLLVTGLLGTSWLMAGWGVLAVTLIGTLFLASGLAIGLSGVTRSAALVQGLSGGLPPLLAMTSGAFFPLETTPWALQQIARINPLFWALETLTEGYVYRGVSGQMVPLSVLVLIGILGMVIGLQGLRRMEF